MCNKKHWKNEPSRKIVAGGLDFIFGFKMKSDLFSLLVCWYMFVGCHLSYITFDPTRRNWISFSYLVHKTPTEEKMCFNFKSFSHLRIWYPTFAGYFVISKTSTLENVIMDPFRASINFNLFPLGNRSLRVFFMPPTYQDKI